jgi:hypothetical protein
MGQPYSLVLNLPPLTGVVLVPDQVELEEDISG